jgi:hypothetical protein
MYKMIVALSYLLLSADLYSIEIAQRLKDVLATQYQLDQTSVGSIIVKLKPLIEHEEHHATLESFINLSDQHARNSSHVIDLQPLPADDAVAAAPQYHEVLVENNAVRVLWGVSEAGDQEPMHRHYWESVLLIIEGATFEIEYADGSKETDYSPTGVWALPADAQAARYKNLDGRCSFLRFEIKR